jgi:hypothetical protein
MKEVNQIIYDQINSLNVGDLLELKDSEFKKYQGVRLFIQRTTNKEFEITNRGLTRKK